MNSLSTSSCEIRRFVVADRDSLIAAIDDVCAEGLWMRTARYEPTPYWEYALANTDRDVHLLLVVCDGENVVGWCRAFPSDTTGEVDVGIGLRKPYRNCGLGTRMIRRTIAWAGEHGPTRLTATTRLDNRRAIHVLKKCGFSPVCRDEGGTWIELELKNVFPVY